MQRWCLEWRCILTNLFLSKDLHKPIKILTVLFLILSFVLIIWTGYSLYNFYKEYKKEPTITESESYIDKKGIEQVKLILEERK